MNALYISLAGMLLVALGILACACKPLAKPFLGASLFLSVIAICLYFFIQTAGLKSWLQTGRAHYQLLAQFEKLGGIKGAIVGVKAKLAKDPTDKKAWILLGKLYLANHDEKSAKAAFAKAGKL